MDVTSFPQLNSIEKNTLLLIPFQLLHLESRILKEVVGLHSKYN